MKLKYISATIAIALIMPLAASALTADDIQQQIRSLLAQIAQLQQQLKNLQTEDPTPVACTMEAKSCPDGTSVGRTGPNCEFAACPGVKTVPPTVVRICPQILRTLDQGITGSDVKDLQTYLGVSPTGYFGPLTARAVAALQADEGLAQVGIVGPQTRAAFARRCGWDDDNDARFSASPTSGQAPLSVNFGYPYNGNTSGGQYTVNFGDGTSGQMLRVLTMSACVQGSDCPQRGSWNANHTYASAGTYTAQLMKSSPGGCPSNIEDQRCLGAPASREVLGTVTIYVGGLTSSASVSVSSPTAGTNVAQGNPLTISWNSQSPPAGSVVGLWLIRTRPAGGVPLGCPDSNDPAAFPCGSTSLGLIAVGQPTSGSYTWTVPTAQTVGGCISGSSAYECIQAYANYISPCPLDSAGVCGSNITAGSYQIVAKLYTPSNACFGGLCLPASRPTILASAYSGVFTIGGSTIENASFSATPTSGAAPLYVVFRTNLVNQIDAYSIDFGDGTSGTWQNNCAFGYGACGLSTATHTYTTAGTYTATLKKSGASHCNGLICTADIQETILGTVTITVGGSSGGGAPSISGLDAPISLAVGQTGTWTVRLNTTNTGNLNYSVIWGDEVTPVPTSAQYGAAPSIAASGTFTHAYQRAGTYSPTFTVSNSSGSARTSASVTVGGPTPTQKEIPVTWSCPLYAMRACPAGQTRVSGPDTYDSNGCPVPNVTCIAVDDSASAEQNTNLANVLTALEAALKKFLGQ